ncbi:hypothetical protein EMPS_02719 [Entomortierella parvispora]|uniref:Uncharacterized protein n=1 Tax=Entomortierella parvispora TaxID=205924 RepID=A0A9P3H5H8_9FUNG|nr:hypothetical protein EMPS_02719 [Entomortierella parvispora]
MIPTTRSLTLLAAALAACTSTVVADVWSTDPVEGTEWKIGAPAKVKWQLKSPTSQTDVATIYLVGGDSTAYKRLATLGENVVLGDHDGIHSHNLVIAKVPEVACGSQCAIEFEIASQIANKQRGDYYSHPFTISATGDTVAKGTAAAAGGSAVVTDKSAPIPGGSPQTAATPSGPITHVQNAANATQANSSSSAAASTQQFAIAATLATMTVMITGLTLIL